MRKMPGMSGDVEEHPASNSAGIVSVRLADATDVSKLTKENDSNCY
jgi:hypothetical protein